MSDGRPPWARVFPQNVLGAMAIVAVMAGGAGLLTVWLGTGVLRTYGVALFCGVPVVMGVAAPLMYGLSGRKSLLELLGVSVLAQVVLFAGMLLFALEGVVCIAIAAPLWMLCALGGTAVAYPIHVRMWRRYGGAARGFPVVVLLMCGTVPLWMGAEHVHGVGEAERVVTTEVEIDAPAEVVWGRVLGFPELPAPGWGEGGWLFKVGIARPVRAEWEGTGRSGRRACVFSTGRAEETVRVWEEGRVLELDVHTTPPSMEETSIYPGLHPAHLEGYLVSRRARFELEALPGGRTRVVGTSWYVNKMAPAVYWGWWSDASIKAVQVAVLGHVKGLSEGDVQGGEARGGGRK